MERCMARVEEIEHQLEAAQQAAAEAALLAP